VHPRSQHRRSESPYRSQRQEPSPQFGAPNMLGINCPVRRSDSRTCPEPPQCVPVPVSVPLSSPEPESQTGSNFELDPDPEPTRPPPLESVLSVLGVQADEADDDDEEDDESEVQADVADDADEEDDEPDDGAYATYGGVYGSDYEDYVTYHEDVSVTKSCLSEIFHDIVPTPDYPATARRRQVIRRRCAEEDAAEEDAAQQNAESDESESDESDGDNTPPAPTFPSSYESRSAKVTPPPKVTKKSPASSSSSLSSGSELSSTRILPAMNQPIPKRNIGPLVQPKPAKRRRISLDSDASSSEGDTKSGSRFSYDIFQKPGMKPISLFRTAEKDPPVYTQELPFDDDPAPLIISGSSRPSCKFEALEAYNFTAEGAPRRNVIFCVERHPPSDNDSITNGGKFSMFENPSATEVIFFRRESQGAYMLNNTVNSLHYELCGRTGCDLIREKAPHYEITPRHLQKKGKVVERKSDGNIFVLNNGKDAGRLDELIEAMQLQSLAMDAFFFKEGQVVVKNERRNNRGFSIGVAGGQSTSKKTTEVAEPNITKGTQRYEYLFPLMSEVMDYLAEKSSVETFFIDDDKGMQAHMDSWSKKCSTDPRNKLQHISVLLYLGELPFVKGRDSNLHPHCDEENCPITSFDWLASVWKRIYFPHIGRYCDIVITGTQRKSISDLLNRQSVIGDAATKLIDLYLRQPEHLRDITPQTMCPPNAKFSLRVSPIHFETTVNFSAPLHHIDVLRSYYSSREIEMSGYLANEMLLGFFVTNNPFRYNEYAKHFVASVMSNDGIIPLGQGETFLGKCQEYITGNFGGFNGIEEPNSLARGACRWQSTNNSPKFEYTNFDSLRSFENNTLSHGHAGKPSLTEHKQLMASLTSSVSGVGRLLSQKLMFADAIIGLHLDTNWLGHCVPGSLLQLDRLKKDYGFRSNNQVGQLIHCIAKRLNILPLKAEEIVCKLLKGSDSNYFDLIFEDQNLFYASRNEQGEITVHKVDGATCEVTHLVTGGFDWGLGSHYYPKWMSASHDFSKSSNVVHMASLDNNKGLLKKKKGTITTKDRKDYDDYVPHAIRSNYSLDKAQTLLVKGYYIAVTNPLHFVATHLCVCTQDLENAIGVKRATNRNGYIPFLRKGALDNVGLSAKYKEILMMDKHRRPLVDCRNTSVTKWSYRSRFGARMAMILHLLTNVRIMEGNHWSSDFLEQAKEIVLLLPMTTKCETMVAVGIIYLTDKNTSEFRQIDSSGKVVAPFVLSVVGTRGRQSYDNH
jgi:hypothetical protein